MYCWIRQQRHREVLVKRCSTDKDMRLGSAVQGGSESRSLDWETINRLTLDQPEI
jgi:hypothetical protein